MMDQTVEYTYAPGVWPIEDNPERLCLPGRRLWVTRIYLDRLGEVIRRRRTFGCARSADGTLTLVADGNAYQAPRYYIVDPDNRRISPVYTRRGDALAALDAAERAVA